MRLNAPVVNRLRTAEGGMAHPASSLNPRNALRRAVLSCLLWEDEFYVDGKSIGERIVEAVDAVVKAHGTQEVADLAIEARHRYNLRHAPLLLLCALAKHGSGVPRLVQDTIYSVVHRADELAELLAIYWKDGKRPLPHQFRKGLARAFTKFDADQLSKWNRDRAIRLRDVLFLVHGKPSTKEQGAAWAQLTNREFFPDKTKAGFPVKEAYGEFAKLAPADTWEVALSAGEDKKDVFTRKLTEGTLGYMALLMNLRNMQEAGVDRDLVNAAVRARKGANRILPFRFVAAARAAPQFEAVLDEALVANIKASPPLSGVTVILVDVSGSMEHPLSGKSQLNRMDAAATLASMINGELRVFTFSERVVEVPPRRGMAGVDAIVKSQPHNSTFLGRAVQKLNEIPHDRLIVLTDEQSHDQVGDPVARSAYMINVASNRNGVGYGRWTHIDGFSESVLTYIRELEVSAFNT